MCVCTYINIIFDDVQSSYNNTNNNKNMKKSNQNDTTTTMCCLWFYFGVYTLKTSNWNALYVHVCTYIRTYTFIYIHIFLNRLRTVLSNVCAIDCFCLFRSLCVFAYKINNSNIFLVIGARVCVCVRVSAPHFHIDFSCVSCESFTALHCRALQCNGKHTHTHAHVCMYVIWSNDEQFSLI